MYCTACGTKNPPDGSFCKQCGRKLDRVAAPKIREEDFNNALPGDEQITAQLERAYCLRSAGDISAAIALCEEVVTRHPESTSAHSLLGQLFEMNGERERAIKQRERVIQLNPRSIADRVRLDELRGEIRPDLRAGGAPHIVLAEHAIPPAALVSTRTLPAVALGMLLLGAALAYPWYRMSEAGRSPVTAGTGQAAPADGRQAPVSSLLTPAAPAGVRMPAPERTSLVSRHAEASGALPSDRSLVTTLRGSQARPTELLPGSFGIRSPRETTASPVGSSRPLRPAPVQRSNVALSPEPGRVVLSEAAEGEGKDYVIRVTPSKENETRTEGASGARNQENKTTIRITPSPGDTGTGRAAPSLASQDAREYLSVAHERMLRDDYTGAIGAYRKALPSSGDETAYVYQQIGLCYQRKGDKTSARSNYQSALAEYQRLDSAGKLTDTRRSGIKVCENGIKVCSSE